MAAESKSITSPRVVAPASPLVATGPLADSVSSAASIGSETKKATGNLTSPVKSQKIAAAPVKDASHGAPPTVLKPATADGALNTSLSPSSSWYKLTIPFLITLIHFHADAFHLRDGGAKTTPADFKFSQPTKLPPRDQT